MCENCGSNEGVRGAVVSGRFISICNNCISAQHRLASVQSAQYSRDRDQEENRRDIIQPWFKGKPNKEFINAYPEDATNYFTEKELKDHA